MSAKILHTSDWHLGKKLFREERTEEHAKFLLWLKKIIKEENIDLLIIAGDIFDVPNPPHKALESFNYFLHDLAKLNVKVFIIGGNHDSALLLEAALPFYQDKSIEVAGKLKEKFEDHLHEYDINGERFLIQSLPYFRNFEIYEWIKKYLATKTDLSERAESIQTILDKFFSIKVKETLPKILCSHHLFGSFMEAGSEQSLNLSGLDSIPLKLLEGRFDYVALGHIHKPQILKKENPFVQYSGSPIPMRFSEKEKKIVNIIEINKSKLDIKSVEIPVFRKLVQIVTNLTDWKAEIDKVESFELETFIEIIIKLNEPVAGLVDEVKDYTQKKGHKLLSYFPNYLDQKKEEEKELDRQKINELSPLDLFKLYYKEKFPDSLQNDITDKTLEDFSDLYQKAMDNNEN